MGLPEKKWNLISEPKFLKLNRANEQNILSGAVQHIQDFDGDHPFGINFEIPKLEEDVDRMFLSQYSVLMRNDRNDNQKLESVLDKSFKR